MSNTFKPVTPSAQTEDRSPPRLLAVLQLGVLLAVLAALGFLWRELAAQKTSNQTVVEQNQVLRQELTQARSEIERLTPVVEGMRAAARKRFPGDSTNGLERLSQELASGATLTVSPVPQPTRTPKPEPNRLVLADKRVQSTPDGFRSDLRFEPTGDRPLDAFAVVVRLPSDSTATILGLTVTGAATFQNENTHIADNGKFAVFQGFPEGLAPIGVQLSVSSEVDADVRVSNGVEPFTIELR